MKEKRKVKYVKKEKVLKESDKNAKTKGTERLKKKEVGKKKKK